MADALLLASRIFPNDFSTLIQVTAGSKNAPTNETLFLIVVTRWVQDDPLATWRSALRIEDPNRRRGITQIVARLWMNQDPTSILAYYSRLQDSAEKRLLASHYVRTLAQEDPRAALQWAHDHLTTFDQEILQTEVLSRWGSVNPSEAGGYLLSSNLKTSRNAVKTLVGEWASHDLVAAMLWSFNVKNDRAMMDAAMSGIVTALRIEDAKSANDVMVKLPHGLNDDAPLRCLAIHLLGKNASEALKFIRTFPLHKKRSLEFAVFREWAIGQPEQAARFLIEAGDDARQNEVATEGLASGLIVSDPPKAVELLLSSRESLSDKYLSAAITSWIHTDLDAVKSFVVSLHDEKASRKCLAILVTEWGSYDTDAACKWATSLADSDLCRVSLAALSAYADRVSTPVARTVLARLPDGELKDKWITLLVKRYSPKSASELISWIEQMPEGRSRTAALRAAAEVWARQDPVAAMMYYQQLHDSVIRVGAIEKIAGTWAKSDPTAAYKWAISNTEGETQKNLLAEIFRESAASDLSGSLALLSQLTTLEMKSASLRAILPVYAEKDPQSAAKWVSEFPEGDLRATAMSRLARAWGLNDPQAAAEWLHNLSASDKEAATHAYVNSADGSRPDLAAFAANELSDERERANLIAQSVMRWAAKDAKAASSWLEGARLDKSTAEELLKLIRQGKNYL
jgi:hypothetical protein